MKGDPKASTYTEYLSSLDASRKKEIQKINDYIQSIVPGLQRYIQSGFIGYGKYHYKYASGREGDWMVVGLASQKNYLSIYVCMTDGDQYLAEKYADQLGKVNVGRSCIRFKKLEDLHLPTLAKVLKQAEKIALKNNFTFIA